MWFKNLIIYRFSEAFAHSAEDLERALATAPFKPCGSQDMASLGWVPPMGRQSQQLLHASADYLLVCLKREERLLPASVVREAVDEKVEQIETEQMRKVRKKERDELRDEIMFELLPRAFTRSDRRYALIAPKEGLLLIDAASVKKAEELAEALRKTIGSLPVAFPTTTQSPASVFTQWIAGTDTPPGDIIPGDECELVDPSEDGGIVRCRKQDLEADEIKAHLNAGKQVTKLALDWGDTLSCVVADDLSVKRLRFDDRLKEEASDQGGEDFAAQFDADFTLMSEALARFVPRLLEIFGGVAGEQADAA
jgi:recombination associated protein RdgC